jgi:hypothetical protein
MRDPRYDLPLFAGVHHLSTCTTCATLHDSSVKTRAKLEVRVDYAHTHGHRIADILVNINLNLGIYLCPSLYFILLYTCILVQLDQRRCSVGRMKEHFCAVGTITV